jgi:hypothetical protein
LLGDNVGLGGIGPSGGGFGPGQSQIINVQHPNANISGAGFITVASFTLTGGLLSDENLLYVLAFIERTTGSGTFTPRLTYGSSSVAAASPGQPNAGCEAFLFANNATNAQQIWIGPKNTVSQFNNGDITEDSTADLTVTLAIDLNTDTDVYVCRYFSATLYRAP